MNKSKFYPIMMALLASILFGASAPITKILLGQIEPIPLASFLYLGSGLGLLVFQIVNLTVKKQVINEAPLKKKDFLWLLGAIATGAIISGLFSFVLATLLKNQMPSFKVIIIAMIIGTVLLLKEEHQHKHIHAMIQHEHKHNNNDEHHDHEHSGEQVLIKGYHSHLHTHNVREHNHPRSPDIHHGHAH